MSDSFMITGLGMTCPLCNGPSNVVRTINKEREIVRRRKCISCGFYFSTTETLEKDKNAEPEPERSVGDVLEELLGNKVKAILLTKNIPDL